MEGSSTRLTWSSQLDCNQNCCERTPEKFRPKCNLNPALCDISSVLYQLSYQASWELVTMSTAPALQRSGFKSSSGFESLLFQCKWSSQLWMLLERDSNPDLCDARCSALPVELSGQLGAGHYVGTGRYVSPWEALKYWISFLDASYLKG